MRQAKTMPKRITINLPDTVAADLQAWADKRGQAMATVAAIAVEKAMDDLKAGGETLATNAQQQK